MPSPSIAAAESFIALLVLSPPSPPSASAFSSPRRVSPPLASPHPRRHRHSADPITILGEASSAPPPVAALRAETTATTATATNVNGDTRLTESELLDLISSDAYAMDISSITAGSERETYIGQGSGVNEGAGIGALSSWLKNMVGRVLARKNRPVYEKLWTIIEYDLLASVRERVPGLAPRPTWFEPDKTEPHAFATDDGTCDGTVAAYKGGRVDWLATCKFFSRTLGFGNMRIDG